ncbi:DUF975 family protein [Anaeromassilibacillus senegalensis]|uniref:DUF975 family protein n=1 Tax=Anaeromassilibacillus senegalensis TaxID=1673717 RepID=UPI0009E63243|nr:DUF975 family protein [Anaeromassilibacillus senegalensis]
MMWSRSILKENAKIALRGRYWRAFVVALVAALLAGFASIGSTFNNLGQQFMNYGFLYDSGYLQMVAEQFLSWSVPLTLIGLLLSIFVVNVLSIGRARYFVQNHFGDVRMETLFSGFGTNYKNSVAAMFVTSLYIFLWSLLFVIPGIYKSYQYFLVPYILSDNPNLPGDRVREISRAMTDGEKMNIFILQLSFIGWYFLGMLCLGVGTLFVEPYMEASMAELYIFLRDRAIQNGAVNPEELGLLLTEPAVENPFSKPPMDTI